MSFSVLTINQARFRQRGQCALCGLPLEGATEYPHALFPQNQGGSEKEDNCVLLCHECQHTAQNDPNAQSCMVPPLRYFPYANIFGSHRQTQTRVSRIR